MPTGDQVKGLTERFVAIGLAWALAKGWIDVKLATDLGPLLVMVLSLGWAWWVNRPKAIVQSAAALPQTTVVTSYDLAHSTPETNIVSQTTNQVVHVAGVGVGV